MPKTGTSLIQAVLRSMRDSLSANGVWIPDSFLGCHRLAVEATPGENEIHRRADFLEIKAAMPIEEALDPIASAASRFETLILSSEYFSEGSPRLLKTLLDSAGIRAAKLSIIAALRRQDRILVSGFNQDVKALNRTKPLLWSPSRSDRHDWHERLRPWAEEFGKAALMVQVFDRAVAGGQSLTCLILDACGVSYDAGLVHQLEERHSKAENRSLPAELLAFKLHANAVTGQGQLDWLIDEAMARGVGGTAYQFDAETTRRIIEHYRDSNRRVAAEYLGESGDLFDDHIDERATATLAVTPATNAALLAICAAELRSLRAETRSATTARKAAR